MNDEPVELTVAAEVAPASEYPSPSGEETVWRATAGMLELFEDARM
jgi:hypothetical protein